MCEPMHSIVQFPNSIEGEPTKIGFVGWAKKKIGDWFHFSKLGFGHSESMEQLSVSGRLRLPDDTKYETAWWNRQTKRDGQFFGESFNQEEALKCAEEYANRVSIGNMTLLRQFLETTMRKTDRNPAEYVDRFFYMLNSKGKDTLNERLKKLLPSWQSSLRTNLDLGIKVLMGFTRKRELLVPEWADDVKLWKPEIQVI